MKSEARSTRGPLRRAAFISFLIWVALGSLASPSSATLGAARYVYEVCDPALPGGNTPGVQFVGDPLYVTGSNTCARPNGSLGLDEVKDLSAGSPTNYWSVPIYSPPGGTIESLAVSAWTCGASLQSRIFAYEEGWPVNCAGESQRTFHFTPASPYHGTLINLGCKGGGCNQGASVFAHYLAATEVDPVAPRLAIPQGSLLDRGAAHGHKTLSAEATDEGGGISELKALVNGQLIGQPNTPHCNIAQVTNPSVAGTVATSTPPCPRALKATWTLDTSVSPFQDGDNTVQVCASDFGTLSDPNTACSAQQTVNVDNSCTESLVVGGQTLNAQFASSNAEKITVPFDHSAKVIGGLASKTGKPVAGATICVQMQTLGSQSDPVPIATATTDASGHFTYWVPPGPNRRVLFGYRHDAFQVVQDMRYFAHAKPTLHLNPNQVHSGGSIRIIGRVPQPRAAGRVVVLEASALHSPRWYQFDRAISNDQGIYHGHFRFDATTQTTTYRIRAEIPRQHEYPWDEGYSTPALVEVRIG